MVKIRYILVIITILFLIKKADAVKDSLNSKLLYTNVSIDMLAVTGSYFLLDKLWYQDYEQSDLHWFNDNNEWEGVDKLGHMFSTYHISSLVSSQMKSSGLNHKRSVLLGSSIGFLSISAIELLDAKSKFWGASVGDLTANLMGSCLYLTQELFWEEQRLIMKFSYAPSGLADIRPDLLGENFGQRLLKDYNAQTLWLSANISLFVTTSWMPKWVNIAFGYGADGMLGGDSNPVEFQYYKREPQFLLSLDIDLRRIKTKSKFIKSVFSIVNIIKIPMPSVEFRSGKLYGHYLYY